MTQTSEEFWLNLMNSDSANIHRVAADCHHHDASATTPLPVSPSPFLNMNETSSQFYSEEPHGATSITAVSVSSQNSQMDPSCLYEGQEHVSLPCPVGYMGWPYQYSRHADLPISGDVTNVTFNLNTSVKPDSDGKCVIPMDSLGTPSGTAMSSNIGQLNTDLGMTLFNQNQGGAGPLLSAGKLDERLTTAGSGSNKETRSNAIMLGVNVTGNSERAHLLPINTLHNQLGNRILSPGLDMNSAYSGFQNDSGVISDLAQMSGQEVMFDSRPGIQSGPWPAAADQSHHFRQVNRGSGLGGVKDRDPRHGFERSMVLSPFPDVGSPSVPCDSRQRSVNGQLVPSSIGVVTNQLPFVQQHQQQQQQKHYPFLQHQQQKSYPFLQQHRQQQQQQQQQKPHPFLQQHQQQEQQKAYPTPFVQSQSLTSAPLRSIRGQDPPIGEVTNQLPFVLQQLQQQQQQQQQPYPTPFVQQPQNNLKPISQSLASAPFRGIRGQDPSSNHGQSQVDGSIQQSNPPLGRHYAPDQGMLIGKGNMTAQVSRQSTIPSLKRPASQPLSSTVQEQRRKTLPTQTSIHPPNPPWTRLPPSAPNTPQTIAPLVYAPLSLTPQATQSFVPPLLPTKSALPAPNPTQTIPPLMRPAPFVPPIDKRISPSRPLSHPPPPLLNQQQFIAQSLARQRLMNQIIQSAPATAHNYIKYKDQTPEPLGYKCMLCKRDLSYAPEGPISQPPTPPAAAVLSCGHTFHQHCLEKMTPDGQSKDPPCIPCALGE